MSTSSLNLAGEQVPVKETFDATLKEFMSLHKEMSQLPQDPKDPLQSLNTMLADAGVDVGTDYCMFLMGAMGQVALDSALGQFGIAAHSPASMAADFAATTFSQRREEKEEINKPKTASKKASVKSVFNAKRKAPTPKRRPAFATSILMASSMKKKAPAAAQMKRRQEMKARLTKLHFDLKDLAPLKAMGYEYATRMNLFDADIGAKRPMLVESLGVQKIALTPERKKVTLEQDNTPNLAQDNTPQMRRAPTALRMAMG